jgi:regulatory protein
VLALRWLTGREHGSRELHEKLVAKGCAAAIATQVVDGLKAERLLSDERFIEALIAARRRRGYGPLRIREQLKDKGVDEEAIGRWLDLAAREWDEDVKQVRSRKFGGKLPKTYAERARQARFLQYRGFTFDQIQRAFGARDD